MIAVVWVSLLGLLTLLFSNLLERQYNPNQQPVTTLGADGVREVVLQRNSRGHYVATGQINGKTVRFLLDTGATDVAVPEAVAQHLDLVRMSGGRSQTANGVISVWNTRLDLVSLGSIRMHDVRASILPPAAGNDQVLLGMSFLKRLEMIQRDGQLTLRQHPDS